MHKTLITLFITLFVAGCAADGSFRSVRIDSGPCGNVRGYTVTGILYADSKLVVVPMSRIRAGTEWRFYLRPVTNPNDPANYRDAKVTIDGKFPASEDPPNRNDWIDVSGSYNGAADRYLVECVPEDVKKGDTFEFLVNVESVGQLDPRARVED
jgi:hypothetical protein